MLSGTQWLSVTVCIQIDEFVLEMAYFSFQNDEPNANIMAEPPDICGERTMEPHKLIMSEMYPVPNVVTIITRPETEASIMAHLLPRSNMLSFYDGTRGEHVVLFMTALRDLGLVRVC